MHARFFTLGQAFRSSRPWSQPGRSAFRLRMSHFVCRGCQSNFSTSAIRRAIAASKKAVQDAAAKVEKAGEKKYPSRLLIYNAGDMRSSFVSFWKATAIFQFGVVCVFVAPLQYRNPNQPDFSLRLIYAIAVAVASSIPMIAMSYLTSPFVKRIYLSIPPYAQLSRANLQRFVTTMGPSSSLEFVTLRAYPMERTSTLLLQELRALPFQRNRFANIERVKTEASIKRWKEMSWYRKMLEIMNEPRWKFYVKEGRSYTIPTGVPGAWEEVAKVIQRQTEREARSKGEPVKKAVRLIQESKRNPVKRQTARSQR